MQSCPKNVHTGPLTGDGKRSTMTHSIAKESLPLPPVALALPLEPASVAGPPSPARGSAGMPPPPSPAGAVYQPKTPPPEQLLDCKPEEKRRKARIGKTMVKNNLLNINRLQRQNNTLNTVLQEQNTMLLMCHNPPNDVKREVESPEDIVQEKNERLADLQAKSETLDIKDNKDDIEVQIETRIEETSQKLEGDDHKDQTIPEESTPTRRKSIEDTPIKESHIENIVQDQNQNIPEEKTPKKRKLEDVNSEEEPKPKKLSSPKSSYKDLIRKAPKTTKLLQNKKQSETTAILKTQKVQQKKKKRKSSETNCDPQIKKQKSNLQNSKLKSKKSCEQIENTEPKNQKTTKPQVNSKTKKLAPEILDSLFTKNNVDRTIESVVLNCVLSEEPVRTSIVQEKVLKQTQNNTEEPKIKPKEKIKVNNVNVKIGASKRKNKNINNNNIISVVALAVPKVPRRSIHAPKWSNGWSWEGEPYQGKIFLNVSFFSISIYR